jgi:hypothetical protein
LRCGALRWGFGSASGKGKEREHGKAFYALCEHMLPGYHQVEFDTRLHLTLLAMASRD